MRSDNYHCSSANLGATGINVPNTNGPITAAVPSPRKKFTRIYKGFRAKQQFVSYQVSVPRSLRSLIKATLQEKKAQGLGKRVPRR